MEKLQPDGTVAAFRLTLLGHFALIAGDGAAIAIPNKKNRAILAILALSPGSQATRERICGLLWGDRGEEQARSSLRQSLAVLRKELGETGSQLLQTFDDRVALRAEALAVDVASFLSLSQMKDAGSLSQAAALYQGQLLADTSIRDASFEDWLTNERRRLADRAIDVLDRLASLDQLQDRAGHARRLVQLDPLREASHRALMRAYAEAGETALALQQFEACRAMLKAEYGVEPADETLALRTAIAKGKPGRTEAVAAPSAAAPNAGSSVNHDGARGTPLVPGDKPSIAVLPFSNLSDDPQQGFFADGLTEDIITELSRFKGLFVIARNSVFAFKSKSASIAVIAKELGVRFLVEGSLRRSGDRARVTARLVDATSGNEVWSERYDRVIEDIFAVQDDVVRIIVATLEGQLASTVASQSRRQTPANIAAYEYVLQARKHLGTYDIQSAEPLLRHAIAADPHYAQAFAWMTMVHWIKYFHHHRDADIAEAVAFGKTAVTFDPTDSVCHMTLGFAYIFSHQHELAGIHSQRALDLNPADMLALSLRAQWLCRAGRSQEAVATLDHAVRQDPFPPDWYWENRTIILLTLEKYEEALSCQKRLPDMFWWNHGYAAVCCAKLGRMSEAREAVHKAIALRPELTIARYMKGEPYQNPADAERMIEGLRAAGLPE